MKNLPMTIETIKLNKKRTVVSRLPSSNEVKNLGVWECFGEFLERKARVASRWQTTCSETPPDFTFSLDFLTDFKI